MTADNTPLSSLQNAQKNRDSKAFIKTLNSQRFQQWYQQTTLSDTDHQWLAEAICTLDYCYFEPTCRQFLANNASILSIQPLENDTWLSYFSRKNYYTDDAALKVHAILSNFDDDSDEKDDLVNQTVDKRTALSTAIDAKKNDVAAVLMSHGADIDIDNPVHTKIILDSELETFKRICDTHIICHPDALDTGPSQNDTYQDTWITYLAAQPNDNETDNNEKIEHLLILLTRAQPTKKQTLLQEKSAKMNALHWALGRESWDIALTLMKHHQKYTVPAHLIVDYQLIPMLVEHNLLDRVGGKITDPSLFDILLSHFLTSKDNESLLKLVTNSHEAAFSIPTTILDDALRWLALLSEALEKKQWRAAHQILLRADNTCLPLSLTHYDAIIASRKPPLINAGKRFTWWDSLEKTSNIFKQHQPSYQPTEAVDPSRKRAFNNEENSPTKKSKNSPTVVSDLFQRQKNTGNHTITMQPK